MLSSVSVVKSLLAKTSLSWTQLLAAERERRKGEMGRPCEASAT